MQLPNFCFIILVLASVFILGCNGATYGQACDDNSNCTDSYQVCSTTCVCDNGYTLSGTTCYAELGYTCTSDTECDDVNAVCTGGFCTCNTTTHYDSNGATDLGTCETKRAIDATCPDPSTAGDSCIDNAECVAMAGSYQCKCNNGYTSSGGQCVQNVAYGQSCTSEVPCAGDNTACTSGICQCSSGYYRNNGACVINIAYDGDCSLGGSCAGDNTVCTSGTCQCSNGYYRHNDACVIKVTTGHNCPSTFSGSSFPCGDGNAVCTSISSTNYTCLCKTGYYQNGGTCTQKVITGTSCPSTFSGSSAPCNDSNAVCTDATCQCKSDYYNKDGSCTQKGSPGDSCPGPNTITGSCVTNAECVNTGNSYQCQCKTEYFSSGGQCVQKVAYGSNCIQGGVPCAGDNTECSGGTCECSSGYYRHNGTCVIKVSLNENCPGAYVSKSLPCKDINAICKKRKEQYKCKCQYGFYDNGGVCRKKVAVGDSCPSNVSSTLPCVDTNAECTSTNNVYTCECKTGYFNNNGECSLKIAVNQTCPSDVTPTLPCNDSNAECTNANNEYICKCKNGYFNNNGFCSLKIALGQTCPSEVTPNLPCNDSNAECTNTNNEYKCKCKNGYFINNGVCSLKIAVGQTCPGDTSSNLPCNDSNAECTNTNNEYKCECKNGYFYNNGFCSLKIAVGQTCPSIVTVTSTLPCNDTNAECTNTNNDYKCECRNDYYNNAGVCTIKVELGGDCPSNAACIGGNTHCSTVGKCACDTGYYDNDGTSNTGGSCETLAAIGDDCSSSLSGSSVPCVDNNAECTSTSNGYKCQCTDNYYTNGGTCTQKVNTGNACPDSFSGSSEPCVDNNAVCTGTSGSYTCQCTANYYYSGGTCTPKINTGNACPSTFSGSSEPCVDNNAVCTGTSGNYTCQCTANYYNNGGPCILKKELGVYCPFDGACSDSNAICSNTKCTCKSGYYDNTGTSDTAGTCIEKKNLGFSCPNPSNSNVQSKDSCKDSFALCQQVGSTNTYTCTCTSSYYDNNGDNIQGGSCTAKVILGGQCPAPTSDVPNTATCLDSKAICVSDGGMHKCLCPSTYYDSNGVNTGGGQCLLKRQLGQSCQYNRACNDSNAICSGVCVCKSGFFDDNGTSNTGGTCLTKLSLGDVCPNTDTGVLSSEPCDDTYSTCQLETSTYRCRCTSDYYDDNGNNTSGGQCVRKVELGSGCPMQDACIKSNSQCVSDTCVCVSDYYDTNTANVSEGDCNKRKLLNATCTERNLANYNRDQCSDQFAKCDSNGYCSCNTGYHQESSGCVANKANGEVCTGSTNDECSDTNSECRNGKCTCKTSYYDNNGQTGGGKCELISQLQVGSIVFSNIQTTGFTVAWSLPSGSLSGFVNYYTVRWTLINQENYKQSSVLSSSTTSYTVTGITPGKAYKVEIISRNTETEVNVERTTTVSKQQAAKPNMIKEITSSGNDLDAQSSGLTIRYTPGDGGKSGYNIRLFDGNTRIAEKNPRQSSTFVTIWNSNLPNNYGSLKHGYRYTVKIITKSESYDNGKEVQSDEFEAEVKTTPKLPNPPKNGQCGNVLDSAITVSWDPPSVPNGDIVRYHVEVNQSSLLSTRSTDDGTTSLQVDGLEPGTSYHFRLITENEVGNSTASNYISTGCKTKARMADAPQNLQISNISSRGFIVTWDVPVNLYSEENFGYDLQISDDTEKCVTRVLYECSNCNLGNFSFSSLTNPCTDITQSTKTKTKNELMQAFSYTAELNPDILYTVTVSAINGAGQGYGADANKTTLEEAPQKPSITSTNVTSKNLTLTWSINGPRPGVTFYDIKLVPNEPAKVLEERVEGFNTRTFTVTGLEEYWDYNVSVIAKTSIGSMESDITSVQTLPAAPGQVSNFNVKTNPDGNYTLIKVSWKTPSVLSRNSIIQRYDFQHNASDTENLETFSHMDSDDYTYEKVLSVTPETYYQFKVSAVNVQNETGELSQKTLMAPPGKPINIEETQGVKIIPKEKVTKVEQTRFTLEILKRFFLESLYGEVQDHGLIGCKATECELPVDMPLDYFEVMKNWKKSAAGVLPYRITPKDWLEKMSNKRQKRSTDEVIEYTVGSEDCGQSSEDTYCNGPLEPDTNYYIVAVVCTNGGCTTSKSYGPFVTAAIPPEQNMLWIIGVVVGVVVIAVIVIVIVIVIRRRGPKKMEIPHRKAFRDPAPNEDKINIPEIDPATAGIQRKRPICLDEMAAYVQKMHKDSNLLFAREYEDLKTLSAKHPCEAADREENRLKNRYINIIPFDHSRVKLSCMDEDDSSDYINANYLPGYTYKREYIACQGPIPGTIDDFWKMVWEQNVSIVVMLTLCKEGQKVKCEQYWPDVIGEPKQYGDVVVEVTSCSTINTYHYRTFKMTRGDTTRIMKQFHFLSWLDFQANVSHDTILDFIDQVRNHVQPPDTSGPIIVHCSAGVGRTGTYICLDHLKQLINESDFNVEIDIFDMVLDLRNNRLHMVQTEQQYTFIHDAVLELMERKRRANNIYENTGFINDEDNIYQNQENEMYANVTITNEQKTVL